MKKTIIAFTALALLTLAPRPAIALGDKEAAILGGIIGGLIIGAAIDDARDHHDYDRRVTVRSHSAYDDRRGSVYERGNSHVSHQSSGYWTYRTVKVWIPKRVTYTRDYCGRSVKQYERGRYEYRREKVWISTRRGW